MAAETTPQGQTPSAGGEAPAAEAPAKAGGLASYLPLIIAILVMPVAAYVTITIKSKMGKASAASAEGEQAGPAKEEVKDSHGSSHGSKEKTKTVSRPGFRNTRVSVPLTREPVAYVAKEESKKEGDVDKIVTLDTKGEVKDIAQSDKIVVNVAGTNGQRYVLARISLISDHPSFIEKLNENRERLIDIASGTLSSKTLEDLNRTGFRSFLKSELQGLFNQQLESTMIQDVVIHEFVIQ